MGNCLCQTTKASECITIQNSNGKKIQILQSSKTAGQVMTSNPGCNVAQIFSVNISESEKERWVEYLMLLRPDDPLLLGKVYVLISFEDVSRVFGSDRVAPLSSLQEKAGEKLRNDDHQHNSEDVRTENEEDEEEEEAYRSFKEVLKQLGRWKPALETIDEV